MYNQNKLNNKTKLHSSVLAIRHRLATFRLIGLQHQIQQALEASYVVWRQRFAQRGQTLVDEATLNTEILPGLLESAAKVNSTDATDLAARLAGLLRGCSNGSCGSFATFAPELANLVALFEEAYRGGQNTSPFVSSEPELTALA